MPILVKISWITIRYFKVNTCKRRLDLFNIRFTVKLKFVYLLCSAQLDVKNNQAIFTVQLVLSAFHVQAPKPGQCLFYQAIYSEWPIRTAERAHSCSVKLQIGVIVRDVLDSMGKWPLNVLQEQQAIGRKQLRVLQWMRCMEFLRNTVWVAGSKWQDSHNMFWKWHWDLSSDLCNHRIFICLRPLCGSV